MEDRMINLLYCLVTGSASSQIVKSEIWTYTPGVMFVASLLMNDLDLTFYDYGGGEDCDEYEESQW